MPLYMTWQVSTLSLTHLYRLSLTLSHHYLEALVGDLTPCDLVGLGITENDKHAMEMAGLKKMISTIDPVVGKEIYELVRLLYSTICH